MKEQRRAGRRESFSSAAAVQQQRQQHGHQSQWPVHAARSPTICKHECDAVSQIAADGAVAMPVLCVFVLWPLWPLRMLKAMTRPWPVSLTRHSS